jgi:hypothetical protein
LILALLCFGSPFPSCVSFFGSALKVSLRSAFVLIFRFPVSLFHCLRHCPGTDLLIFRFLSLRRSAPTKLFWASKRRSFGILLSSVLLFDSISAALIFFSPAERSLAPSCGGHWSLISGLVPWPGRSCFGFDGVSRSAAQLSPCFGSAMRQCCKSIPLSSSGGCPRPAARIDLRS